MQICDNLIESPTGEASVTRRVFASLVKYAITDALAMVSKDLIWSNASSFLVPHNYGLPVRVSSYKRLNIFDKPGINLAQN